MMHRDLPYYESIRAKTRRENKLYENKHANPLHTCRKWSITRHFNPYYKLRLVLGEFTSWATPTPLYPNYEPLL